MEEICAHVLLSSKCLIYFWAVLICIIRHDANHTWNNQFVKWFSRMMSFNIFVYFFVHNKHRHLRAPALQQLRLWIWLSIHHFFCWGRMFANPINLQRVRLGREVFRRGGEVVESLRVKICHVPSWALHFDFLALRWRLLYLHIYTCIDIHLCSQMFVKCQTHVYYICITHTHTTILTCECVYAYKNNVSCTPVKKTTSQDVWPRINSN